MEVSSEDEVVEVFSEETVAAGAEVEELLGNVPATDGVGDVELEEASHTPSQVSHASVSTSTIRRPPARRRKLPSKLTKCEVDMPRLYLSSDTESSDEENGEGRQTMLG